MLVYRYPQPSIEFFLCHGIPGWFSGRQNFNRVTFFCGIPGTHDGPNLGFKLSVTCEINVILRFILISILQLIQTSPMRSPVRWATRKRRSDRSAHSINFTVPACRGYDRLSTQAPETTSTQHNVALDFWQVHSSCLKTGKHQSRSSSECLRRLLFMIFSPKVSYMASPIRPAATSSGNL